MYIFIVITQYLLLANWLIYLVLIKNNEFSWEGLILYISWYMVEEKKPLLSFLVSLMCSISSGNRHAYEIYYIWNAGHCHACSHPTLVSSLQAVHQTVPFHMVQICIRKTALHTSKTQIQPRSASMLLHSFQVVILLTFECLSGRHRETLCLGFLKLLGMHMWYKFTRSPPSITKASRRKRNLGWHFSRPSPSRLVTCLCRGWQY